MNLSYLILLAVSCWMKLVCPTPVAHDMPVWQVREEDGAFILTVVGSGQSDSAEEDEDLVETDWLSGDSGKSGDMSLESAENTDAFDDLPDASGDGEGSGDTENSLDSGFGLTALPDVSGGRGSSSPRLVDLLVGSGASDEIFELPAGWYPGSDRDIVHGYIGFGGCGRRGWCGDTCCFTEFEVRQDQNQLLQAQKASCRPPNRWIYGECINCLFGFHPLCH